MASWRNRIFTNLARHFLDDWLPPVARDNRLLFSMLGHLFHGPHFDLDFKRKAHAMTEDEFVEAYVKVSGKKRHRPTDMTEAEIDWMINNAVGPKVLEVGCGEGVLAMRLAEEKGLSVSVTELSSESVEAVRQRFADKRIPLEATVANLEQLPFADKSFDSVLCAHTLEHVRRFDKAVQELVRVTRRRLLVIVPCQRFYRYTIDYHLSFFQEPEQLLLRMGLPNQTCEKITGDLCYRADFA